MLASFARSNARRRGVVLVLVLGMLGLLALIGVTFATFSGQAQINARKFAESRSFPESGDLMDYALAQLIGDASKPDSVIRGHSLLRDMYGVDAVTNGPLLSYNPDASNQSGAFQFLNVTYVRTGPYTGTYACQTNIPTSSPTFASYSFGRWVVRVFPTRDTSDLNEPIYALARTFEVLAEDTTGVNRVFYLAVPNNNMDSSTSGYPVKRPGTEPAVVGYRSEENPNVGSGPSTWTSLLRTGGKNNPIPIGAPFALDGRFLRAFNGPGMGGLISYSNTQNRPTNLDITDVNLANNIPYGHPLVEFANFRYNGNLINNVLQDMARKALTPAFPDINNLLNNSTNILAFAPGYGDPNRICGMDEDYDACDLENWFLSLQSADGEVVIPSFHRPGILTAADWTNRWGNATTQADRLAVARSMSKILRPRRVDGHSAISFPDLTPDSAGKITYDVDNDGDGKTDSVWLDLGYPARRNPLGQLYKPLFAFTVIGLNGKLPLNSAGNLQQTIALPEALVGAPQLPYVGTLPVHDHAEHLGNSPSEIDLRYALQNAYDPQYDFLGSPNPRNTQFDNAFLATNFPTNAAPDPTVLNRYQMYTAYNQSVALTQLRTLLTGARPADAIPNLNGDRNIVMVDGQPVNLPNNLADGHDFYTGSSPARVVINTDPIPGRWGESFAVPSQLFVPTSLDPVVPFANNVRAGMSVMTAGSAFDARDDNKNTFDDWPLPGLGEDRFGLYAADRYDAAGALSNPVERMRRFVTPVDLTGVGRVVTWNSLAENRGADPFGRVSFFNYFRPPGTPTAANGGSWNFFTIGSGTAPNEPYIEYVRPEGLLLGAITPDTRNNRYHGYEAARNPDPRPTGIANPLLAAGTPSNWRMVAGVPTKVPTFSGGGLVPTTNGPSTVTNDLNSGSDVNNDGQLTVAMDADANGYIYQSPALNEADEMNLYQPSPLDSPFGAADLEWLYRYHDVDGQSLTSRLKQLVPISFDKAKDAQRRRRLFALDSWEPTNFVWANDNPGGFFPNNSRFRPYANASFTNLNNIALPSFLVSANIGVPYDPRILNPVNNTPAPTDPAYDFSIQAQTGNFSQNQQGYLIPNGGNSAPVPTPSLAHRDRRINLNFPLPVSNHPEEPVRQKWIRETYQLLKAVLPPKAVDTPEELARLSQFVVNIIDFRDPDATMTKFVNTDLMVTDPTDTVPPVLAFSNDYPPGDTTTPTRFLPAYNVRYTSLNSWLLADNMTRASYLIQHGMEYQPVAINEVLALRFNVNKNPVNVASDPGRDGPQVVSNDTTRMFIELASTLTKSEVGAGSSTLDLNGWDLVVMPDDGKGRPDPFTGQIPNSNADWTTIKPVPVRGGTSNYAVKPPASNLIAPLPSGVGATPNLLVPALQTDTTADGNTGGEARYYYVLGNGKTTGLGAPQVEDFSGAVVESDAERATPPATANYVDLTSHGATPLTPGNYYWLYLRRPPNPFDTVYDSQQPNDNRVVVDSFRFVFNRSKGYGWTNTSGGSDTDTQGGAPDNEFVFSAERMQPLRGGHAVRPLGGTGETFITAYGFSEQTYASEASTSTRGLYDTAAAQQINTTGTIHHTLGSRNSQRDDARDLLVFHDRDFTSVAELTLVPGCPPGLFTKQFVEVAPGQEFSRAVQPPRDAPLDTIENSWNSSAYKKGKRPIKFQARGASDFSGDTRGTVAPHVFPYLRDEFFYTGQSEIDFISVNASPVVPIGSNVHWLRTDTIAGTTYNYQIGGPSGAGWYKMLEFFDVPSPVNGSIGKVADGVNFDWARQDLKPGLLNLNLIIDEEVFYGLMGPSIANVMNRTPILDIETPRVVSQVDDNGQPTFSYQMANVGFLDLDNPPYPTIGNNPGMKAAFADFLKLRHGGSGYIFAHGRDVTGAWAKPNLPIDPNYVARGIAADRPYRSLSFPDINYTILRPAALPPSLLTDPVDTLSSQATPGLYPLFNAAGGGGGLGTPVDTAATPIILWVQDPGIKNPYLMTKNNPIQPPAIPPRRLFQIPDEWSPAAKHYTLATDSPSNAAEENEVINATIPPFVYSGDPTVNTQTIDPRDPTIFPAKVTSPRYDLTRARIVQVDPLPNASVYLGAARTVDQTGPPVPGIADQREHPYFRSEWLQKMANLTTVRTHQYAVWITVGFFEVTRQGDPQLAQTDPLKAYDLLGLEVGALEGRNVRYRGFFLVDRTRAVGFNPAIPGDSRDSVVYRQLIE